MEIVKTDDLSFGAYLIICELRLVGMEQGERGRVTFKFQARDNEHAYRAWKNWNKGSVLVPALAYRDTLNYVKAQMRRFIDSNVPVMA